MSTLNFVKVPNGEILTTENKVIERLKISGGKQR